MRKFDRRDRDRECLRVALRLTGDERAFIQGNAHAYNVTPAAIVTRIIQTAMAIARERTAPTASP